MATGKPKKWALVWAGPIATQELDELFPNMSERYPRTVENLLMDDPNSFEHVNPAYLGEHSDAPRRNPLGASQKIV